MKENCIVILDRQLKNKEGAAEPYRREIYVQRSPNSPAHGPFKDPADAAKHGFIMPESYFRPEA